MPSKPLLGIACKIASGFLFAIMLAMVKSFSFYGLAELVFFRCLFALLTIVVWLAAEGEFPRALRTNAPLAHLTRAILGLSSMVCMFAAYMLLPLAEATAFTYASPIIMVVLAALILKEPITGARVLAVGVGFCGMLVMLADSLGQSSSETRSTAGVLFALGNALLASLSMLQTRRLTQTETTGAITFYFQGVSAVLAFAVMLVATLWPASAPGADFMRPQGWTTPAPEHWLWLLAIGILGGTGQILLTQSYRYALASIVACFEYVGLIWAVAIGLVIFNEVPKPLVMLGGCLVVGAGLIAILGERRWRRGRSPSP